MRSPGRLGPVGLVAVEQIAPEGLGRIVEDHGDMGRRRKLARLAQELPQHGAEAVHRADRQPVGGPRQRRQRVIGAEDVARSVDQIDVVALCHRPAGGAVALCCCHDGRNIGIGAAPRESLAGVIHHAVMPGERRPCRHRSEHEAPGCPACAEDRRCLTKATSRARACGWRCPLQTTSRGRRRSSRYSPGNRCRGWGRRGRSA